MKKKIIFYILVLAIILLPSFAFAAINSVGLGALKGPLISCTGFYSTSTSGMSTLPQCTSLCDLIQTAANVIYFGISVALFIIMPILFVWGGLMFMFSRGKPEGISKAKSILTGAVIGLLIVLGAWLIVNTVVTVLFGSNNIYIGGFGTATCGSPQNINNGD